MDGPKGPYGHCPEEEPVYNLVKLIPFIGILGIAVYNMIIYCKLKQKAYPTIIFLFSLLLQGLKNCI